MGGRTTRITSDRTRNLKAQKSSSDLGTRLPVYGFVLTVTVTSIRVGPGAYGVTLALFTGKTAGGPPQGAGPAGSKSESAGGPGPTSEEGASESVRGTEPPCSSSCITNDPTGDPSRPSASGFTAGPLGPGPGLEAGPGPGAAAAAAAAAAAPLDPGFPAAPGNADSEPALHWKRPGPRRLSMSASAAEGLKL